MATLSTLGGFSAGALAACGAVTVTNPMEVVKTRLQLQGELAAKGQVKKVYTGVFQALRLIAVNEGIKGTPVFVVDDFRNAEGAGGCSLSKCVFVDISMAIKYV
jgi:solute carrier family 25 protein 34/35